ncbi:MAG: trypsin-like peptidase domain-containing protein [bacterium]|nr:trypsin-like peptidase domain-containing protein [bacterium]
MEKSPIVKIIKKTAPAVVSIIISRKLKELEEQLRNLPFSPFDYFGFSPFEKPKLEIPEENIEGENVKIGGGSGFIVSADGLVLTNKHVIYDKVADYTVVAPDEKKYPAKVIARDPINDVAILKIDGKNLPIIEPGDSSILELGETVIAIGTALGQFQNTVSTGVVSGLSRFITAHSGSTGHAEQLRGLIQTDAAINPGNSGGPLLNMEGKAIGINAAIVFGAQNIGFAIPINTARKDLEDIEKYGRLRKPFLGLRYLILDKRLKTKHHLPVDYGAYIIPEVGPKDVGVVPGSPAFKAGIKENDIIMECNNQKVTEKNTLQDLIQKFNIGETVNLKIWRAGKTFDAKIKLAERSSQKE